MNQIQKFQETLAVYRKHGWRLARVLMRRETLDELRATTGSDQPLFESMSPVEAPVDAMWFSRPSQAGREAWELRLVADPPYALFELFEPDEEEEDREDVRREMEARLREYAGGGRT